MAYEKQTWSCGDEISADKLNHMEDGIFSANSGGGTLVVRAKSFVKGEGIGAKATLTFDKSWQDVHDAIVNGVPTYFGVNMRVSKLCNMSSLEDTSEVLVPIIEAVDAYESVGNYYLVILSMELSMEDLNIPFPDAATNPTDLLEATTTCGVS